MSFIMARRAGGRDAVIDLAYAKRLNNTCPICWMPLHVGVGDYADKWERVQMVFKSKPTFSIKNGGTDHSRAVHVFGLNPFTGSKETNCEACHFLHHVTVGNEQEFIELWEAGTKVTGQTHPMTSMLEQGPTLLADFFLRIKGPDKIFKAFYSTTTITHRILEDIRSKAAEMTAVNAQAHLKKLLSRKFAGCVDCNSKMTNLDFIEPLFEIIFPNAWYVPNTGEASSATRRLTSRTKPAQRTPKNDGFNNEMMLHYIMLTGLLTQENVNGNIDQLVANPVYTITTQEEAVAWLPKCIIMFCCLQILFCKWKMATLYTGVKHHTNYIYRGVEDFYLSLLFYSLYIMHTHDKTDQIGFEEFHYYYTSMMPFYCATSLQPPYRGPYNLCSVVLTEEEVGAFSLPVDPYAHYDYICTQMHHIQESAAGFWMTRMLPLCTAIHTFTGFGQPSIKDFFTSSEWVREHREKVTRTDTELDLQTFCTLLTPQLYWLHFKYITLPSITRTSTEYLRTPHMPPTARLMWFNWCRTFDAMTHQLSVRFHMEQKAARIRLRMM
jgi:hypothetical protein